MLNLVWRVTLWGCPELPESKKVIAVGLLLVSVVMYFDVTDIYCDCFLSFGLLFFGYEPSSVRVLKLP